MKRALIIANIMFVSSVVWGKSIFPQQEGNLSFSKIIAINSDAKSIDIDNEEFLKGLYPLHYACTVGNENEVRNLIEKENVDINGEDIYGRFPLTIAAEKGNSSLVKYLLDNNADPNAADNIHGDTPLFIAIKKNFKDIVKILLACNTNSNKESIVKALYIAIQNDNTNIAKLLINNGANVNQKADAADNSFHIAVKKGNIKLVKYMVEHCKANVNAKGSDDFTPLNMAIDHGYTDIVKYLINHGANVNEKGMYAPLRFAKTKNQNDIVEILKKAGAKE